MTDRLAGVVVTFEQNIREDNAEATIAALQQVKGVLSVEPVVGDVSLAMAESRAKHEVTMRVYEALRDA